MRQIVLDELHPDQRQRINDYLHRHATASAIDDLFLLPLPDHLLAAPQQAHPHCGPFCLAVELRRDAVHFELLVRASATLRCQCIAWADARQRQFLLDFIDTMVAELHLDDRR